MKYLSLDFEHSVRCFRISTYTYRRLKATALVDVGDKVTEGFSLSTSFRIPLQTSAVYVTKSIMPVTGKDAKEIALQLHGNI
jgi:hypothetical protein